MAKELQVGDKVQLVSGGPGLTVILVKENTVTVAYWSEQIQEFKQTSFVKEALNKLT